MKIQQHVVEAETRAAALLSCEPVDIEAIINNLNQLCLLDQTTNNPDHHHNRMMNGGLDRGQWADYLVEEMRSATNVEDARERAARILENFEKSKDSLQSKKQMAMGAENAVLKRAVAIQCGRLKEGERRVKEMETLVREYEDKLRSLEVNNYALSMHCALSMHLKHAQEHHQHSTTFLSRFNPDVY